MAPEGFLDHRFSVFLRFCAAPSTISGVFRVFPLVVYDRNATCKFRIEHEWFSRHWFIKLVNLTDGLLVPICLYFTLAVGFCASQDWPGDDR